MSLDDSMRHWRRLARDQENEAARLKRAGEYAGAHEARAKLYNRTAEAIRLQIATGNVHCTVCLGPHPNHECPKRPGARR